MWKGTTKWLKTKHPKSSSEIQTNTNALGLALSKKVTMTTALLGIKKAQKQASKHLCMEQLNSEKSFSLMATNGNKILLWSTKEITTPNKTPDMSQKDVQLLSSGAILKESYWRLGQFTKGFLLTGEGHPFALTKHQGFFAKTKKKL